MLKTKSAQQWWICPLQHRQTIFTTDVFEERPAVSAGSRCKRNVWICLLVELSKSATLGDTLDTKSFLLALCHDPQRNGTLCGDQDLMINDVCRECDVTRCGKETIIAGLDQMDAVPAFVTDWPADNVSLAAATPDRHFDRQGHGTLDAPSAHEHWFSMASRWRDMSRTKNGSTPGRRPTEATHSRQSTQMLGRPHFLCHGALLPRTSHATNLARRLSVGNTVGCTALATFVATASAPVRPALVPSLRPCVLFSWRCPVLCLLGCRVLTQTWRSILRQRGTCSPPTLRSTPRAAHIAVRSRSVGVMEQSACAGL